MQANGQIGLLRKAALASNRRTIWRPSSTIAGRGRAFGNGGTLDAEGAQVAELQIDDLLKGAATGTYPSKLGSQFGSLWGFDGLTAREALAQEYAAFGASARIRLGHGQPVRWLGREWSTILTYNRKKLEQVNIHTDDSESTFADVRGRLQQILGEGHEFSLPQDDVHAVTRRFSWNGPGGVVSFVRTPTFLQVRIGRTGSSGGSAGCLGVLLLIASGLSMTVWFAH
jgi:hypothetical protein